MSWQHRTWVHPPSRFLTMMTHTLNFSLYKFLLNDCIGREVMLQDHKTSITGCSGWKGHYKEEWFSWPLLEPSEIEFMRDRPRSKGYILKEPLGYSDEHRRLRTHCYGSLITCYSEGGPELAARASSRSWLEMQNLRHLKPREAEPAFQQDFQVVYISSRSNDWIQCILETPGKILWTQDRSPTMDQLNQNLW